MKIPKTKILFLVSIFAFFFGANVALAKEYHYQKFEVDITVKQDSTFDVAEKQTYYLDGNYGFFNRDIATKGTDAVTDIQIYDEFNNTVPKRELDIKSITGAKHIQWNFPRRDFAKEEKSWTVKYKVHGGISFLKNYDEIYWNAVPSVRDVAIKDIKVTVRLENGEKFRSDLIRLYAEDVPNPIAVPANGRDEAVPRLYGASNLVSVGGYYFSDDDREAIFWGRNLKPNTNFTIATGFPKGIVNQSAYWKDFLGMYYGYVLSIIIIISSIIIGFLYWYKTEKSREDKRAIIPQYEPPQNLRPAMAEVIIKEKLTDKGLAATIIDLAVRGYVRIKEEEKGKFEKYILIIIIAMFLIVPFIIIINSTFRIDDIIFFLVFGIILFSILSKAGLKIEGQKDYAVKKVKNYKDSSDLEDYEKEYLQALFGSGDHFSTKELKKSPTKSKELYEKIQKVKDEIYKEIELDTKAFEVGLRKEKYIGFTLGAIIFGVFMIISVFGGIFTESIMQPLVLIITIIGSIIVLRVFIKYEARLSDEGIKLKEDWLGFKMYLETAEKYRMQNLKPEYFEKYLPYAMIFGVEKKWAKAFESLHMPPPNWYVGSAYAAGASASSTPAGSFSPSVFSASFASSFASAISSSGASGASGGGSGAGGGGGGGGGGAG